MGAARCTAPRSHDLAMSSLHSDARVDQHRVPESPLIRSYASLFAGLLPEIKGSAHFDARLNFLGGAGSLSNAPDLARWLSDGGWQQRTPSALHRRLRDCDQVAMPLLGAGGAQLGAIVIDIASSLRQTLGTNFAATLTSRLRPALECLQRELAAPSVTALAASPNVPAANDDRAADLEWLFHLSADTKRSGGEWLALQRLLESACARIGCTLSLLTVPSKNISLTHAHDERAASSMRESLGQLEPHLIAWAVRKKTPLLVNAPSARLLAVTHARILAAPVMTPSGRAVGVLTFLRDLDGEKFNERHQYLASHLGRQVATAIDAQFDIATGLPTRASLEQNVELRSARVDAVRSLVYIDIDALHICNEKHGFEIGDELIVRIADLLSSGLLPPSALIGRTSGDRFAVVLEDCEPREALEFTKKLQEAAERIVIGPPEDAFEVSISCGVAALVDMPKGFSRALAAGEVACKAAKDRGRNRTELYACEDTSMMRRHGDVIIVGQLREAIRKEQLCLYAQRIVRLDRERSLCGLEVLLRWRDPQGQIVAPGSFMSAAQRYQLLPQIDRYVVRHALATIAPYCSLLMEIGATVSINVSGQSLSEESFVTFMLNELRTSNVVPGTVTWEITEQTAVASLEKSAELMRRLRQVGCKVALDDFGIGANSFAYLKALPATRLKIDGSFVTDMQTSPRSVAMVRSLAGLAREFQMDCVAEYVESEALARKLESMGVDAAQGYAFGHPHPIEEALQAIRSEESQRLRAYWLEA